MGLSTVLLGCVLAIPWDQLWLRVYGWKVLYNTTIFVRWEQTVDGCSTSAYKSVNIVQGKDSSILVG
jgi:hypothetical protein